MHGDMNPPLSASTCGAAVARYSLALTFLLNPEIISSRLNKHPYRHNSFILFTLY
jgi:hypothetical protein